MKLQNWLMVGAMLAALAACGNDSTDDTTSGGSTDTASSSGGDAASSGDATSGSADGGGSACLSSPATPTGGWGVGCTADGDQKWLTNEDNVKAFPALIRSCTLGGCAGAGDDAAIQKCIGDCLKEKSKGLSAACSTCYGTWAGWCGFKKCISVCAVDDGTDKCDKCLACHCTPNRDACTAGDKK